jgi:neutral trehalase
LLLASHLLSEAESGWDFTTRFNACCENIAVLDLNCLLYLTNEYPMPDFLGWTAGVYMEYALELVGP